MTAWDLMLENLIDEFFAAEDFELLRLFTSAYESRSDIEFFLNGDCYASLSGAVQFGDDNPRERNGLVKFSSLIQSVTPGSRINNKQGMVRSTFILLAKDTTNFSQLFHQVVTGVEAACSVADQYLSAIAYSLLVSRVADRCWICVLGPFNEWNMESF